MERTLLMTGIGGQGIQLAARVLAEAAMSEGRHVQLFGSYGGMMRGGNTDATIVVGDRRHRVAADGHGRLVGHRRAPRLLGVGHGERLGRSCVVLLNSSVFTGDVDRSAHHVVDVPATELAAEAGHVMAATMVMAGAYAATTGLVSVESLVASRRRRPARLPEPAPNSQRESDPGRRRCRAHGRADGLAVAGGAQMTPPLIRGTVVIDVEACKGCRPVHRRLPALASWS